jgi:two-component system, OmpR family, response regulator
MSSAAGSRPSARILIVNDDPTVADSCSRALRLEGYEVWAALSAEDGLRLAQAHTPNVVVLDIRTSLARALGLARSLRELPRPSAPAIAIVSGDLHPRGETLADLSALGAHLRYKPLWLDEMVALARSLAGAA